MARGGAFPGGNPKWEGHFLGEIPKGRGISWGKSPKGQALGLMGVTINGFLENKKTTHRDDVVKGVVRVWSRVDKILVGLADDPPVPDVVVCSERQRIVAWRSLARTNQEGALPTSKI